MKRYLVGRSRGAELKVAQINDTVGKQHMEVTEIDGRFSICDLGSANGTYIYQGGQWNQLSGNQEIQLDTQIQMGEFVTTLRKLGLTEAQTSTNDISEDATVVVDDIAQMLADEQQLETLPQQKPKPIVEDDGVSVVYRRDENGEIVIE